jgi:hypothetical protein
LVEQQPAVNPLAGFAEEIESGPLARDKNHLENAPRGLTMVCDGAIGQTKSK